MITASLLALPVLPLWAFSSGSLTIGIGAFLMQFMVQGAWDVIPSYHTGLVPANSRAVLPNFVYQLGKLLALVNATLQATVTESHGNHYGLAMALVAGTVAILIAICGASKGNIACMARLHTEQGCVLFRCRFDMCAAIGNSRRCYRRQWHFPPQ